jgi:transcriptional regulator with XRE-family HTH domain
MAQEETLHKLNELDINGLITKGSISSELEFQRASMADRSLRLLSEKNPALNTIRKSLRQLIRDYETIHWSNADSVTEEQITESDAAQELAFAELNFVIRRHKLILKKLKEFNLKQKDLASLLSHSKSYTSELLNGVRPFSTGDLILIHKLLKIDLNHLLITSLSEEIIQKVNATIEQIASENANTKVTELTLSNK